MKIKRELFEIKGYALEGLNRLPYLLQYRVSE